MLVTALEQFIENQPELDEWEPEETDVFIARVLLEQVEDERLQRVTAGERLAKQEWKRK